MSDTPRTDDASFIAVSANVVRNAVDADFARELEREHESLLWALRKIHDTFAKDIERGYVTKDKTFAIEIAKYALDQVKTSARSAEQGG